MGERGNIGGTIGAGAEAAERLLEGSPLLAGLRERAAAEAQGEAPERLRLLLDTCRSVLADDKAEPATAAARALLLAVLAEAAARADGRSVWRVTPRGLAKRAEGCRPGLVAVELAAEVCGCPMADLLGDGRRFAEVWRLARDFETAVRPARVGALLKDPASARDRVQAFVANLAANDEQVTEQAAQVLCQSWGLAPDDALCLVQRIGLPRLRTFSSSRLCEAAGHFVRWGALIRYLEARRAGGPADPVLERQCEELRRSVLAAVLKACHSPHTRLSPEDAVQEAFFCLLEPAGSGGYTYEGNLASWLITIALNKMRRLPKGPRSVPLPPEDTWAEPPHAASPAQLVMFEELALAWRERFELVLTYFKGPNRWRVQIMREEMLYQGAAGKEVSDADLAAEIERREPIAGDGRGVRVTCAAIAVVKRRLLQRLEALRYVLDKVPAGAEDEPGDVSVCLWVERQHGVAGRDVPTLRRLAGLARASVGEGTLAWALLARLFVDLRRPPDDACQAARRLLDDRVALWPRGREVGAARLSAARAWMEDATNGAELAEARRGVERQGFGFLAAPAWLLVVLRSKTGEEVAAILRPAARELAPLASVVGRLEARRLPGGRGREVSR